MNLVEGITKVQVRILIAVVLGLVLVRTVRVYLNAADVHQHIRELSYESYFKVKGLVPASKFVQGAGTHEVFTVPEKDDEYLFERLSELSYPMIVKSFNAALAPDGAVVVLPKDKRFSGRGTVISEFGDLVVLRYQK